MPSLAALSADRSRVFWKCDECGAVGDVDLPALIAARGPDLDLTDRHPPCRTPGCRYWVRFYAQDGQRTRALATSAGGWAESRRRTAWLAGGGGRNAKTPPAGAEGVASDRGRGI